MMQKNRDCLKVFSIWIYVQIKVLPNNVVHLQDVFWCKNMENSPQKRFVTTHLKDNFM